MNSRAKAHPHEQPHHPHWPLAAMVFAFVFAVCIFSVHETSTWLNIRTGADILSAKSVPSADSLSYTSQGRAWSTDSWLSDVLFYHLDRAGGPQALIFLKAVVIALAFALLLPINPLSPLIAVVLLALAACSAWPGLAEKPAMFDFLMLALLVRVLRPRREFSWQLAVQIGVIEMLWANLNGSSAILGVFVVGIKLIKAMFYAKRDERVWVWVMPAIAVAGLALNPHGLGVVPGLFIGISESPWHTISPWFNLYSVFAVLGLASVWVCLQTEFLLAVSAAGLLGLSLLVVELRPLYAMSAAPLMAVAMGHFQRPLRQNAGRMIRLAVSLAALFALHYVSIYLPLGRWRGYGASSLDGAVFFLKSNALAGKMFNEIASGDELAAKSGRLVFIDGRSRLHGASFVQDARNWEQRWDMMSQAYRFDYAVILNRRASYPARALDADRDWQLAYADDAALVYVRKSGVNGWLVSGARKRLLEPNRLWPDALDGLLKNPQGRAGVLAELDQWMVQSPDSLQALLWKSYALSKLNLGPKAERLLAVTQRRRRWQRDPELTALMGFVFESQGRDDEAKRLYHRSVIAARGASEHALESAVLKRLAGCYGRAGNDAQARRLQNRAQSLAELEAGA